MRVVADLVEHQQAGAEVEAFGQVVGDHEYGQFRLAPQLQQQVMHVLANAGVERAEGFVQQQHAGFHDQCLSDRQPLLHATGQLRWVLVQRVAQTDFSQQLRGLLACLAFGPTEQTA